MSMRLCMMLACVFGMLLGCGPGETATTGGAGGTGGATVSGSTGGSSTVSSGGPTVSTGSGSTSTPTCDVPGPVPCGPSNPTGYPDPLLGYDPGQPFAGYVLPLDGETSGGAASVVLGPWGEDRTIAGIVVERFDENDDFVLSIWTEDTCGLPAEDPNEHIVDVESVNIEPLAMGINRRTGMLTAPFLVPAGMTVHPTLGLPNPLTAIMVHDNPTEFAPRAHWFGRVDNDCDGETDPNLGWAGLDNPTDPSVGKWPYDLAIGVVLAP